MEDLAIAGQLCFRIQECPDADPTPPAPQPHTAPEAERGRGLALVRTCADGWGWYPLTSTGDTGKYVWCELSAA
jgi:hypothetical protein